jgi:hypothetical protein
MIISLLDFQERMMIIDVHEIESQIRRIAKAGSRGVALSRHCREERMPERNVDFQDILHVLNWGKVVHDPDPNTDNKFKVIGEDLEGVNLCVVIIILDENSLLVKTVHG